jgi:hypothetical protein
MMRKPTQPLPEAQHLHDWEIYRASSHARSIAWVEAKDADEAIAKAVKEFKVSKPSKLTAVWRGSSMD